MRLCLCVESVRSTIIKWARRRHQGFVVISLLSFTWRLPICVVLCCAENDFRSHGCSVYTWSIAVCREKGEHLILKQRLHESAVVPIQGTLLLTFACVLFFFKLKKLFPKRQREGRFCFTRSCFSKRVINAERLIKIFSWHAINSAVPLLTVLPVFLLVLRRTNASFQLIRF